MNTLLADPASLHLEKIVANAALISVVMKTTGDRSPCPECGRPSARVHSRYQRRLADLPWEAVAVRLELHLRKFFCRREGFCASASSVSVCPR